MSNRTIAPAFFILLATVVTSANGGGLPSIPGTKSLMTGIPNVSSISAGNAAGVLSYCLKNKVLSDANPTNALNSLMKKPGVKTSSGYSTGQAGNILTGNGEKFSLGQVPSELKSQACNAVLKQAPKLL